MSNPIIIDLVEDDLLPSLEVEWENSGDVSAYDSFTLKVKKEDGTEFERTGIVLDDGSTGNNAIIRFDWQTGDLTRGRHSAAIKVLDDDSPAKPETWPGIELDVDRYHEGLPSMSGRLLLRKDDKRLVIRTVRSEVEVAREFTTLVDEVGNLTYVGETAPGTATSADAWRIYRLDESGGGAEELRKEYANGSTAFEQIWDNRLTLSYS